MAHFAELDKDNVVARVIVVHNNEVTDPSGNEQESLGVYYCRKLYGMDTRWKQASYNENFRKNFPAPGYVYDPVKDAFYSRVAPAPDMEFDEATCKWQFAMIPVTKV